MIKWRYCGQYNNTRQHPIPGYGWISGAEARRRYHDPSYRVITAVSPIDVDSQIGDTPYAAYVVVITTGPTPHFAVIENGPPGLPHIETNWIALDADTVFAERYLAFTYPPLDQIERRRLQLTTSMTNIVHHPDGTASRTVTEFYGHGAHDYTATSDTLSDIDTKTLRRPAPKFGEYESLFEGDHN